MATSHTVLCACEDSICHCLQQKNKTAEKEREQLKVALASSEGAAGVQDEMLAMERFRLSRIRGSAYWGLRTCRHGVKVLMSGLLLQIDQMKRRGMKTAENIFRGAVSIG